MENLKQMLNVKNMSVYQLAKLSQIGQSTAHELIKGNRDPKLSTVEKIANTLGCTIDELFNKRGVKNV